MEVNYRTGDRVGKPFEEQLGRFLGLFGIPSPVPPASFDCRTAHPDRRLRRGDAPAAPVRGARHTLRDDDFFPPGRLQMKSLTAQASSPLRAKSLDGLNRMTLHRCFR